jgi:hypothetical protein
MRGKPGQIKIEGDEIGGDGQNISNENLEFRDGILTRAAPGWGVASTEAIYLGSRTAEGSWRIVRSSNSIAFQRLESSAWVEKGAFST